MEFVIENGFLKEMIGISATVEIPDGVTDLYRPRFRESPPSLTKEQREAVKTLILPAGAERVAPLFAHCPNLKRVYFPSLEAFFNQVKVLSERLVFDDLYIGGELMTEFPFPEGMTKIPDFAYSGWRGVKTLEIPEGIEEIGEVAFKSCENIETIIFPKSLRVIGDSAFGYSRRVKTLVFPRGLETIDRSAFCQFSGLERVYFPDSLKTLASDAFIGDWQMKEWHFESLDCYFRCNRLQYAAYQKLYIGDEPLDSLTFPEGLDSILPDTCGGFAGLRSVFLPNGVKTVGEGAFKGCLALEMAAFPESLTAIGQDAFGNCPNLKELHFASQASLTAVADHLPASKALYVKGALMKKLLNGRFTEAENVMPPINKELIVEFVMPKGVTVIEEGAFADCPNLRRVILREGITELPKRAFYHCAALSEIIIPEGVKTIGEDVFAFCRSLVRVLLPKSLEQIGEHAFLNCERLEEAIVPDGTSVHDTAFRGCTARERLAFLAVGEEGMTFPTVVSDNPKGAMQFGKWKIMPMSYTKADSEQILKEAYGHHIQTVTESYDEEYGDYTDTDTRALDKTGVVVKDGAFFGAIVTTKNWFRIAYQVEPFEESPSALALLTVGDAPITVDHSASDGKRIRHSTTKARLVRKS